MSVVKSHLSPRGLKHLDRFRELRQKEENRMRKIKFGAALLAFSLLLGAGAIAGNSNKGTLNTDETVSIAGKQLPAGRYQVEWTGSGPGVEVSISKGGDTVAKVPAQLVTLSKAGVANGYSTNADQAGNKTLTQIFFGGKKYELSIGETSAATPSDKAQASN